MDFYSWWIGLGIPDARTGNINTQGMYSPDQFREVFRHFYGKNGHYKNNQTGEMLVAVGLDSNTGGYHYIPINRVVNDCFLDFEGRVHKLHGLEQFIDPYVFRADSLVVQKESPYKLHQMSGLSIKGKNNKVNEDHYAHIFHPGDNNIKLMIVADGMGGMEAGNLASHMLVKQMVGWFISVDPYALNDTSWLQANMHNILHARNKEIYNELIVRQGINTGTTVAVAIANNTDMVYANVGDSRICILQDGQLKLASVDDSPNWRPGDIINFQKLEQMRTASDKNVITQYMGQPSVDPYIGCVPNDGYTDVFLFSDGVTDCVSYSSMEQIAQNIDKNTIFEFINQSAFGVNTPGAKSKGVDDSTIVHYSVR